MPRIEKHARPLEQIFNLSNTIGPDNVLLNDAEIAAVEAGDDTPPIKGPTVANRRSRGDYPFKWFKAGREPRARLTDVLAWRDKRFRAHA